MKLLLFAAALLVLLTTASNYYTASPNETTAYDYFVKIGFPEAERILKAETAFLRSFSERIAGGSPSSIIQIPWQAGLVIDIHSVGHNGVCGASLLSANRLITAAHCWHDGKHTAWKFTVVLGSNLLFTGGIRILTTNVVPHPNWNPLLVQNDIAMIIIPTSVSFSSVVSPINLPLGPDMNRDFAGTVATVSGYGKITDRSVISTSQFLSYATIYVISNKVCNLYYPGLVLPSNICTSGLELSSPCGGDSGGPLIIRKNGIPVLIGVVSYGTARGCDVGLPTAYSRVSFFLDFIQQHMEEVIDL